MQVGQVTAGVDASQEALSLQRVGGGRGVAEIAEDGIAAGTGEQAPHAEGIRD